MKTMLLISLLAMSTGSWAFNDDACYNGNAGENNPHCVQRDPVNTVPEPSTVLLLAMGAGAAALARRRARDKTRMHSPD